MDCLITTNIVCTDVHCSITVILLLYLHFALGVLYESDLDVLVEDLSPVNSKWKEIGTELYVRVSKVEASHPSDGLLEVLRKWLYRDGLSHLTRSYAINWHHVVRALRSVGEGHLASELKVKYGELSTTDSLLICNVA